jgi:hypothetical protein
MPEKHLLTGQGWRLGYALSFHAQQAPQDSFQNLGYLGLVGGDNWALELSDLEFQEFCRLTLQLQSAMSSMVAELSDQESLSCKAQSDRLTIQVSGFPNAFNLYFCLTCHLTGRKAEGSWTDEVVTELLQAIQEISLLIAT